MSAYFISVLHYRKIIIIFQNVPNLNNGAKHQGIAHPAYVDYVSVSNDHPSAWIMATEIAKTLQAYKDCKIILLPQTILPMPCSFTYAKNSSLSTLIHHHKQRIREAGLFDSLLRKYLSKEQDCRYIGELIKTCWHAYLIQFSFSQLPYPKREGINITKAFSALFCLAMGLISSYIILIAEQIYHKVCVFKQSLVNSRSSTTSRSM